MDEQTNSLEALDQDQIKLRIGEAIVEMANETWDKHQAHKERALDIYYSYIGKFKEEEEPAEAWKSKLYPKLMKPKILAAWSQYVQAATSNKNMWEVEPYGLKTPDAAALGMKEKLHETADEADLQETLKTGVFDKLLYGSLHIQAPIVETRVSRRWEVDLGQNDTSMMRKLGKMMMAAKGKPQYRPVFQNLDYPTAIHRNFFEMFPWPYSNNPQKGEGIFHRPLMSKYDLNDLKEQPGFDKAAIDEILSEQPAESKYTYVDQKMEARGWGGNRQKGYDMIFFTGKLGTEKLKGIPGFEKEDGRYVEGMFWIVNSSKGPKAIRLQPNRVTGKIRPWLISHYEQMPGESLGMGIGENSIDIAKAIGGATRLFADGKKAALPMIGIDSQKLAVRGNVITFEPMKIWDFTGVDPKNALFSVSLPDVTGNMIPFIEFLERLHDEITGLPKWTTGVDSKMLNKTATGVSMIMNASSQLVRGAIENIDDYILEPLGERWYDWYMEDPKTDPAIKGDFIIKAAGLTNLMQKEQ